MAENPVDIEARLARQLRLISTGIAMPVDRDARKALFDKAASAVDELRTAREENGRLRKALSRYVAVHDCIEDMGLNGLACKCELCQQARAALKGTP